MEESAGEGGAWGIALLASYLLQNGMPLAEFLSERVFASIAGVQMAPDPKDAESFKKFMVFYKSGLKIERSAIENLKR